MQFHLLPQQQVFGLQSGNFSLQPLNRLSLWEGRWFFFCPVLMDTSRISQAYQQRGSTTFIGAFDIIPSSIRKGEGIYWPGCCEFGSGWRRRGARR